MKHFKLSIYFFILLSYILLFTTFSFAVTLSDNFETNDGSWQNYQAIQNVANPINSHVLETKYTQYTYKYYAFGSSYANKNVTIDFDAWAVGNWDSNDIPYIYTYNGSATLQNNSPVPNTNGTTNIVKTHYTFTGTTDANGYIALSIYNNSTQNTKIFYIDNVIVKTQGTPPTMGAIPSITVAQYDLMTLNLSTYTTLTEQDPILSYALTCTPNLSGVSFDSATGIFTGHPTTSGVYNCDANATDVDGTSNTSSFTVTVTQTPPSPPKILPIPNQTMVLNTSNILDLSVYVTPTDGDPILHYTLLGTLPQGLSFNTNTGAITGQPTAEVNATLKLYATDKDGDSNTSTFILSIKPSQINNQLRKFHLRYQKTFPGKMLTIGNTILVAPQNQTNNICKTYTNQAYISNANKSNDKYQLCAYHKDGTVPFATTQASLNVPNTTIKRIKWVGLYWQSLVKASTDLTNMQIKIKHSSSATYQNVSYQVLDKQDNIVPGYTSYSAFADVTQTFVDNNWTNGDITVGNIPVVEGKTEKIGSYGAWTLVYIYEDSTEPLQNFSVYDGYQRVDYLNNQVDINIDGFFTPINANNGILAQISVFAAEGDKYIAGDGMEVKPSKQASFTPLITNFDSSINTTPSFTRLPNPSNNQGIDIHAFQLGTTGKNIILPKETSMVCRFKSVRDHSYDPEIRQDTYFPSMIAFSAELYTPKMCYDYTVKLGDNIHLSASNRDINTTTYSQLPLKIQFLIHSEEADFTFSHAKARVHFSNTQNATLHYKSQYSEMSPPLDNQFYTYATHPEIEQNASNGQIGLGEGVIGIPTNDGGLLRANQSTYAITGYDINSSKKATAFTTHFDIILDTKITFNPGDAPVSYQFTTDNAAQGTTNALPRCPSNPAYSPVQLGFNVEHAGSGNEAAETIHTLYTQIAGRPYDIDIVSYAGQVDNNNSTPFDYKYPVEIELIDADNFQNSAQAGYDTTCRNPKAIGTGKLIPFDPTNGEKRHRVHITTDWPGYPINRAIRDAAYRLWILTTIDSNGSRKVVPHTCTDITNADDCFGSTYRTKIDVNNTGKCVSECSANNPSCYQCLKNHYATAVCSRDNFSIRPASFYVHISDDKQGDTTVTSLSISDNLQDNSNTPSRLAGAYDYKIDISATTHNSNTTPAIGYFSDYYNAFVYSKGLSNKHDNDYTTAAFAALDFNDSTSCSDQNSSTFALLFQNGSNLSPYNHFRLENVGKYELWLRDNNWTVVDRSDYPLKPKFGDPTQAAVDDCITSSNASPTSGKVGCSFDSITQNHYRITLQGEPFRFSLAAVALKRYPDDTQNYTFLNNFSHPYYQNITLNPIDNASITYEGLIKARGGTGATMSNFTNGCAAEDVILHATVTSDTNLSNLSNKGVKFQQYLQDTSIYNTIVDKQEGLDKNVTLPKSAFRTLSDSLNQPQVVSPGQAQIYLHTTFKKPKTSPIDPMIVRYVELNASSSAAWSKHSLQVHNIPDGNHTYDRNITYYFAKVTPLKNLYPNVTNSSIITPLAVDIYCSFTDCNQTYNLTTDAVNGAVNWYAATMFNPAKDGTTDLSITTAFGKAANPSVNPNSNVQFIHQNATRNDVNVSLAGPNRPSTVDIQISAKPWLTYNPNDSVYGYAHYQVQFIGNTSWSGVGNTGEVTETTSNTQINTRVSW